MSNIQRALSKLESMTGKTYMYMARHEKIMHYYNDKDSDVVFINTTNRAHRVAYDKLTKYLDDFKGPISDEPESNLPVRKESRVKEVIRQQVFVANEENQQFIINALKKNIEDVQKSKDAIPQAFEINQQIKTMIGFSKIQLSLAMQFGSLNENE